MRIPITEIEALMHRNRRQTGERIYTVPSPASYPYQWFWDSCFHAITLSHFDMRAAEAELESLAAAQYSNGMIAHVMYWKRGPILDVPWLNPKTSDLIQPPIFAPVVDILYERSGDTAFLERIFPALINYYDFLARERDIRGAGLVGYVNPDESGEDNSPRFDAALQLPPQHLVEQNLERRYGLFRTHKECELDARCTAERFWVEDVPQNTFMVWSYECLARLAAELGDHTLTEKYDMLAKRTAAAMRTHMFKNGRFSPLTGVAGAHTPEDTWARFAPLITRQYSSDEARTLIEDELMNEDTFWLPHGVPTVAKGAAAYDPAEPSWGEAWQHPHWRGPIWMSVHWFINLGLKRYGYNDLSTSLKERSLGLIEKEGFREYYHPKTGIGMGAHDFTWGTLVIDM